MSEPRRTLWSDGNPELAEALRRLRRAFLRSPVCRCPRRLVLAFVNRRRAPRRRMDALLRRHPELIDGLRALGRLSIDPWDRRMSGEGGGAS